MEKERIETYLGFGLFFILGILLIAGYLIGGIIFGFWGFGGNGFDEMPLISLFFGLIFLFLSIPSFFKIKKWKYGWWVALVGIVILLILWLRFIE